MIRAYGIFHRLAFTSIVLSCVLLVGCGNAVSKVYLERFCSYGGVKWNLSLLLDLGFHYQTHAFFLPFLLVDLPFSFIADTIELYETWNIKCEKKSS